MMFEVVQMDKEGFERCILATMHNAEGKRGPTDHLRRLAFEIEALRLDRVSWAWITRRLNVIRQDEVPLTAHKVRTYWSDCKQRTAAQASPAPIAPTVAQRPHPTPFNSLEKAQARQARTDARRATR
jgi:hypothetical protein